MLERMNLTLFFEHQRDPHAVRIAAYPARHRDAFMAHWIKILGDETITKKTILFDGQVAGNVVSFEQFGKPPVGYWIGKSYWGRALPPKLCQNF